MNIEALHVLLLELKERQIRIEQKLDASIDSHSSCSINSTRERSRLNAQIELIWLSLVAILPSIIVNYVLDFKK